MLALAPAVALLPDEDEGNKLFLTDSKGLNICLVIFLLLLKIFLCQRKKSVR
jgi:hypothetical protein